MPQGIVVLTPSRCVRFLAIVMLVMLPAPVASIVGDSVPAVVGETMLLSASTQRSCPAVVTIAQVTETVLELHQLHIVMEKPSIALAVLHAPPDMMVRKPRVLLVSRNSHWSRAKYFVFVVTVVEATVCDGVTV